MQQPKKKMSLGKKILIGLGVLLLIGIIGSRLDKKHVTDTSTVKQTAPLPLSQAEEPMSQAAKDSMIAAEQQAMKDNMVTAKELSRAYEENEVKADNNFKGKTFYVSGTVEDIKKDITDNIYVTLVGDGILRNVQCYFDDAEIAGELHKGMKATFKGTCDGLMMNVQMRGCELVAVK